MKWQLCNHLVKYTPCCHHHLFIMRFLDTSSSLPHNRHPCLASQTVQIGRWWQPCLGSPAPVLLIRIPEEQPTHLQCIQTRRTQTLTTPAPWTWDEFQVHVNAVVVGVVRWITVWVDVLLWLLKVRGCEWLSWLHMWCVADKGLIGVCLCQSFKIFTVWLKCTFLFTKFGK